MILLFSSWIRIWDMQFFCAQYHSSRKTWYQERITFGHNGFEEDDTPILFPTRLEVDIEGNTREVRDEIKQNEDSIVLIVMIYDHDMLGNVIRFFYHLYKF
jgi:hypothetical protein